MSEKLNDHIPLPCCDIHFLHPSEFKVYSLYINDYLKINDRRTRYELHKQSEINTYYISKTKSKRIIREYDRSSINRPMVEVMK